MNHLPPLGQAGRERPLGITSLDELLRLQELLGNDNPTRTYSRRSSVVCVAAEAARGLEHMRSA